jgi:hypothetical protein
MNAQVPSDRVFTDGELLAMAVTLLKHARETTAIHDCRCHECSGFKQESRELLDLIERRTKK